MENIINLIEDPISKTSVSTEEVKAVDFAGEGTIYLKEVPMCKLILSSNEELKSFDIAFAGENSKFMIYRPILTETEGYSYELVSDSIEELGNAVDMETFIAKKITDNFIDLTRASSNLSTNLLASNIANNQIKFMFQEELNLDKTKDIELKIGKSPCDIFTNQTEEFKRRILGK